MAVQRYLASGGMLAMRLAISLMLLVGTAAAQTWENRGSLQPPDLVELTGHVGKPVAGGSGGWEISLGVGFSAEIYDFHLAGMRILNSGRLPLSVLSNLEPYRPTFFLFAQPEQRAALAAASPADGVLISGYRPVGSRTLMVIQLSVRPPVTPAATPLGIE